MKDKKNNIKINKKKLVSKKKILIPQILENKKNYQNLIQNNKEILKKLQKKNGGFIRHFDISDNFPNSSKYEADNQDIKFIKEIFKFKSKDKFTQKELARNKYVRLFENCIEYLENTEDSTFKDCLILKNIKIPLDILEKIHGFWIQKCKKFKRPVLRKHWKDILEKEKYGTVDRLKKAFHQRESRMKLRKTNRINRISKEDLLEIRKELLKENDLSYSITKLIVYREKLKYFKIYSYKDINSKHLREIEENVKTIQLKILKLENELKKIYIPIQPVVEERPKKPEEITIPTIKKPPIVQIAPKIPPILQTNDLQYFFANTIKFLNDYGFKPEEFCSKNIDIVNHKIKKIKQGRSFFKSNIEKKVNRKRINDIKNLDISKLILIKRKSFTKPQNFYFEKLDPEKVCKSNRYNYNNFTDESVIRQNFMDFQNNYSHCNFLSNNCYNPYSYKGKSNFIVNDEITEKLKLKRYNRFFDFYDHQTIDVNPVLKEKGVEEDLGKSILELNLRNGKKNFLKKQKA